MIATSTLDRSRGFGGIDDQILEAAAALAEASKRIDRAEFGTDEESSAFEAYGQRLEELRTLISHPNDGALDVVDLYQVAKQRGQYVKELVDQLLWEIDGDDAALAHAGVSILGEVTERLQSISRL